jgi:hypothetical protein
MGFKRKLFSNQARNKKSGNELDLRSEFETLIYGGSGEIPHKKKILVRRFRLEDGKKVACTCLDPITLECAPVCNFCLGEGYYWDEEFCDCYSSFLGADSGQGNRKRNLSPGVLRTDYKIFYLKYDKDIKYSDKIVELKLDTEGLPIVPYIRQAIYNPQTIVENRSDYGKLEFYSIYCREQDAIREDP